MQTQRLPLILFNSVLLGIVTVFIFQGSPGAFEIPRGQEENAYGCVSGASSGKQKPFYAFESGKDPISDPNGKGWHREYEDNDNYAESWFFMVQTKQSGVLFVTLSVTNIGLRTFDGACDVRFYTSNGDRHVTCTQYRRKDISGARDRLDLTIGPNHLVNAGRTCRLKINEKNLQLDMTLKGVLPEFQFGNGRVSVYEDRSAEWNIHFDAPRAVVKGALTADGRTYNLAGKGYYDHTWSTIKFPTLVEKWYALRIYDRRFSIILHQLHLTDAFGGNKICAGIIGDGARLIPVRSFLFRPLRSRKDETSGFQRPIAFEVSIKTGGYWINGTIKEERFLDSIDVLGQLSWPTRTLIKTFYTKPYLIRYLADCDINLTDRDGVQHHISGLGVVGTNFY
jgi:hypothetical protein